jgi:hypothetical protein
MAPHWGHGNCNSAFHSLNNAVRVLIAYYKMGSIKGMTYVAPQRPKLEKW